MAVEKKYQVWSAIAYSLAAIAFIVGVYQAIYESSTWMAGFNIVLAIAFFWCGLKIGEDDDE